MGTVNIDPVAPAIITRQAGGSKRSDSRLPAVGTAAIVASVFVGAIPTHWAGPISSSPQYVLWLRVAPCTAALLVLVYCLGKAKFGRAAGALITEQNVMSLSRLQAVLWTTLVLGTFAGVALARVASEVPDPLNICIASEVWALLGISGASLVGTPFLLSTRRDKDPVNAVQASQAAADHFDEDANDMATRAHGPLYVNPSPADARLSDIFEGDELANTYIVDLAKVQMFVFTIVSALVWAVAAIRLVTSRDVLAHDVALPSLPVGLVTLLGVSNAGYLANKLVDHTPTK